MVSFEVMFGKLAVASVCQG